MLRCLEINQPMRCSARTLKSRSGKFVRSRDIVCERDSAYGYAICLSASRVIETMKPRNAN